MNNSKTKMVGIFWEVFQVSKGIFVDKENEKNTEKARRKIARKLLEIMRETSQKGNGGKRK